MLSSSSVVYSLGAGTDISFDLELIKRFNVKVHAFDPTPRCIDWLKTQSLPAEFVFYPIGISNEDGQIKMAPPANPNHVSSRPVPSDSASSAEPAEFPVKRLATIAKELGHPHLDLVKIDVEGLEYLIVPDCRRHRPIKPPSVSTSY